VVEDEMAQRAMLDEALKKGALVWLEIAPSESPSGERGRRDRRPERPDASRSHARWYAWSGEHIYLLTGRDEQPDPGLVAGRTTRVVVRSKDNRHRLVALDADVAVLRSDDADWEAATADLAKARLNLFDAEDAPRRWAGPDYALYRLTPRLPLVETAGGSPDQSRREAPVPTPATTTARKPWVLHRRGGHGRRLS
jgi:hypothetical protein